VIGVILTLIAFVIPLIPKLKAKVHPAILLIIWGNALAALWYALSDWNIRYKIEIINDNRTTTPTHLGYSWYVFTFGVIFGTMGAILDTLGFCGFAGPRDTQLPDTDTVRRPTRV
jgi:hypothetical protein